MRALAALRLLACAVVVHGCALVAGIEAPDTSPAKQHCVDGVKDADEIDIDCGGNDCLACGGAACKADTDCESGGCVAGKCAPPSCSDGVFDGYESSLDCGDPRGPGVGCQLCVDGLHCFNGCNCASAFCDPATHLCAGGIPNCDHCTDGVEDTDETDVDCGGATGGATTCPRCQSGQKCGFGTDCASGTCNGGTCM